MLAISLLTLATTTFSTDDYLSFPTRSSLVSSGTWLAWLEETRGTVNVLGCELPKCTPKWLTNYTAADAIAISSVSRRLPGADLWNLEGATCLVGQSADLIVELIVAYSEAYSGYKPHYKLNL